MTFPAATQQTHTRSAISIWPFGRVCVPVNWPDCGLRDFIQNGTGAILAVERTVIDVGNGLAYDTPKTKGRRRVPLTVETTRILSDYLDGHPRRNPPRRCFRLSGNGSVVSNPAGINCTNPASGGSVCSASYPGQRDTHGETGEYESRCVHRLVRRWLLRCHTHLHRRIEFQPIRAGNVPEATRLAVLVWVLI